MKEYWKFPFYNIFLFYYKILRFLNGLFIVFLTKLADSLK